MEILNKSNCTKQCSCGCLFSYDKNDINFGVKQVWIGFWEGGWATREYRYVTCPVYGKSINLE